MEWTDEKPTEPGWYWQRDGKNHPAFVLEIVEVDDEHSGESVLSAPGYSWNELACRVSRIPGQWAGPIPEPTDPA